jgi:hypothetical protein
VRRGLAASLNRVTGRGGTHASRAVGTGRGLTLSRVTRASVARGSRAVGTGRGVTINLSRTVRHGRTTGPNSMTRAGWLGGRASGALT